MDMNRNMGAAVPAQLETAWAGHVDGSRLTFWLAGAATGHASSLSALTTGISLRLLPNRQKVICVDDERARKEKSRAHTQASDSLSRSSPSHSHARPQSARNKISTTLSTAVSVCTEVWFGLVWNGTPPRHRNGVLSRRFAHAPQCSREFNHYPPALQLY